MAAPTSSARFRWANVASSTPAYQFRVRSKRSVTQAESRVRSPGSRTRRALMTGERVSATRPDMITAMASVNANSLNSTPVSPDRKPMGAYTAASVIVMETMGAKSCRALASAASTRPMPRSTRRCTFSTTTMASSTTRPTESTTASRVSRFSEKPSRYMKAAVPTREMGMATRGTSAERSEPMNRKTTSATMATVSTSVVAMPFSALRMYTVPS